ncbi:Pentatricopeptide repeat-containing protein [Drosera capensis]
MRPPLHHIESTLIATLTATTHLSHLAQIHALIYRTHLHTSNLIISKLLRTLTRLRLPFSHPYPQAIFDQVTSPNSFLWTSLIHGYSSNGQWAESLIAYKGMRRARVSVLTFTLCAVMKAIGGLGEVDLGVQMHCEMMKIGGFGFDLGLGNGLVEMYVRCGRLGWARKVFEEMPERDVVAATVLVVELAERGEMGFAREVFDGVVEGNKDLVAWSAMVTGYVRNARPGEALEVFRRMMESGIGADEVALVGAVSACAQLGARKYAGWVRDVAEQWGIGVERNVVIGSAFVDMYLKCGMLEDACEIFQCMIKRNVYSYSSMILGFATHGRANDALQLFNEMCMTNVKPNAVTFIGVLTACGHAGMVEQGRRFFSMMKEDYGIEPSADHYTCMVDLLGRAGCLEEAMHLAKTMTVKPHAGVWGALLGACRIYKNPEIAEIAAAQLFSLEPSSIANYILLANIHGSAGRWADVSRVRKLMRTRGLKKNHPGCSWIEGRGGTIHEFYSGDTRHPNWKEINDTLQHDLLIRFKLHGYGPILDSVPYDVNDDEKKRILMFHSEKLALVFAFLNPDDGASAIRIMKNIRICEDCHWFMCVASKVIGRQIVIRDNMRFHHFHDGKCSCGNFW